jgi:ParB/RepB/Spo0J family partition protein
MFTGKVEVLPFTVLYLPKDARAHQELRNDGKEIYELMQSIQSENLINPISVYIPPNEKPPYRVIAGGRRYTACMKLQWTEIPCRVFDTELTEHELKSIELMENVRRRNLTAPERDLLIKQLDALLREQKGPKIARRADAEGHSQADTARLIGVTEASVSQSISTANYIEQHTPEEQQVLVKMKRSQLQKHRERQKQVIGNFIRAAVAEKQVKKSVKEPGNVSPKLAELIGSYRQGDFFNNDLPAGSFAFIECDPPFGLDLQDVRDADYKGKLETYREVSADEYEAFIHKLCVELYRLASPVSWTLIWHKAESYKLIFDALESVGFKPRFQCGIWKKGKTTGGTRHPSSRFGNSYEQFLYAQKGDALFTEHHTGRSAIFDHDRVPPAIMRHPTQKPLPLLNEIVDVFSSAGSAVLVPFAGSGVSLISAILNGRKVIGYDLSKEFRDGCIVAASEIPAFKQMELFHG